MSSAEFCVSLASTYADPKSRLGSQALSGRCQLFQSLASLQYLWVEITSGETLRHLIYPISVHLLPQCRLFASSGVCVRWRMYTHPSAFVGVFVQVDQKPMKEQISPNFFIIVRMPL